MQNISCFILLILFPLCLSAQTQSDTTQKVILGRQNNSLQSKKPYVILISADGFRHDYAEKYGAENLLRLSGEGVRAEALIPSYPTFTFPSHYTIVTGMHPARHGLISNHFYDRQSEEFYSMRNPGTVKDGTWYNGIPLWVLAEQQKMLTAVYYWVGSEADIAGIIPTYHYAYNEKIPVKRRISQVRSWLELPEEERPHLIAFYFPEVDQIGHRFGPDAPETRDAVLWVDSCIGLLTEEVNRTGLPVNFVFLSDHGMTRLDPEPITLPSGFDREKFIIPPGAEILHLFAKEEEDIPAAYQLLSEEARDYDVYLQKDLPEKFRPQTESVWERYGDIILISHWPRAFSLTTRPPLSGGHGFDPYEVPDMRAVFYAWGPAFKKGMKVPAFESIHVFPLITSILGLEYEHTIDGDASLARKILE